MIKRFVTLIEMMVVIFLIGLILGFLAYNYRGGMDKGKALKTEVSMERLETLLNMHVAEDPDALGNLETKWPELVERDPLVKNPATLIYDGWGNKYKVTVENNVIHVESERYKEYKQELGSKK